MAEESQVTLDSSVVAGNEDEASGSVEVQAAPTFADPKKPDVGGYIWGTGRRKAAVARVRIKPGKGEFKINGKAVDVYFTELRDQGDATVALKVTKTEGSIDVYVNTHGGGYMGQAGAVKLGLARALKGYDPTLEPVLREHDLLSRDPRRVERKKYGRHKARRSTQFSKR